MNTKTKSILRSIWLKAIDLFPFRQGSKHVVNCNPNLSLQLPDAIALRQKVMAKFPQSENFGDGCCFVIATEDMESMIVSRLEPAIRDSALELGLSLPVEFMVHPYPLAFELFWIARIGVSRTELTESYTPYTTI